MSRLDRQECEKYRSMLDDKAFLNDFFFFNSPKTGERHVEEFRMWLDGASYKKIGDKFGITPESVRQNLIKASSLFRHHYLDEKKLPDNTNITKFGDFISEVARDEGLEHLTIRTFNAFVRNQKDPKNTDLLKALKEMEISDIWKIRGIGSSSMRILVEARKRLWHVCDRCGKELPVNYFVLRLMDLRRTPVDLLLCNDCQHELAVWLKNPEEGDKNGNS